MPEPYNPAEDPLDLCAVSDYLEELESSLRTTCGDPDGAECTLHPDNDCYLHHFFASLLSARTSLKKYVQENLL